MFQTLLSVRALRACVLALFLVGLAGCGSETPAPSAEPAAQPADPVESAPAVVLEPPMAEQREHVVSAPAGDREDPWYWLRDDEREDPEVLAYLEAENEYKEASLAHLSGLRERLFEELRGRIVEDDSSTPIFDNGYWYYTRYESGKEYPIHARREGTMEADEEILLDVNVLAEGHDFYSVGDWDVSLDNRRLAYLEDNIGRRQYRILIKDLATGETVDTGIVGASSLSWSGDHRHLFYVANEPETLRSWQVWRLDTAPESVQEGEMPFGQGDLVYQEDDAAFYTGVGRTDSGAYNVIYLGSTVSSEMRVLESDQPLGEFRVFFPRERDHEYYIDHHQDRWIVQTNFEAPNYRLMTVGLDDHADRSQWQDLVPHSDEIFIHTFTALDDILAISERSDGLRRLRLQDWDSGESQVLAFEEPAYVAYLGSNPDQSSPLLRFYYESMTTPTQTWDLNVVTGERTLLKQEEVPGDFDSADYVTHWMMVPARDGVEVPVSIMHHKDTQLDGSAPLYQYAYGSYGSSTEPSFSTNRLSLVDRGFVFAIAHVRGGQEMGRQWYDDGRMLNKINTFNDFIDVTAYLVDEGMVDGERVFAMGGSAGGLLTGAVANMAPERYAGIIAHVPFVDVVTTMLDESIPLTTNEFDEWGNPMDPVYYEYMLSYSPYDNVTAQDYPAMLVTTGLWDSQVQYWEPAKWVAKLRATKTDDNPLLLHTNMEAGHGGASGRFRRLEQAALEYAFVLDQAGLAEQSD
ncbi:S9 family peptidase [Wenzhouxiangella marina]|uniref:Oligopeptidase B n=1 Tax=Wenzhouxiangella marina TaxID=1579979 RepID=A0A0K0XV90_9GAMM|nr:S9 family peptidase [Wenzhouxiangella marina]AKS41629.1 Oligopeptidase B [Wenzhouxiangella marina]MBB6086611.1 oligopeptidase B [Wenzhouxiangella marina]